MSGTHPSDEALQQYVLAPAACAPGEIDHIAGCPECQEAAGVYRALSDALREQPAPTFNFDLAAAVIANLQTPQPKRQGGPMLTAALIAGSIIVPAWLFRRSAYFVFTDMSAAFYWVLLAAAGIVFGFFLLRLYKKYQDVINLIN